MAERCVKGDYIGFTFGDVHSSELGLMRVSNGSRYEQDLLPPLQDKTAQVNGRDGAVYFNSQYNTKPIKVPVAFDNMTEESFQKLKELVMDKKPKYLWFDETPYKQWLVKAGGLQSFKWVCFDESKNIERLDDEDSEGTKKRIYKGEGTLEFICFTPYAESRVTFLDDSEILKQDGIWIWNRNQSPKKLIRTYQDFYKNKNLTFKETEEKKCEHTSYEEFFFNSDMKPQNCIIAIPKTKDSFDIFIYKNNIVTYLSDYRVLAFATSDMTVFSWTQVARDLSTDSNDFGVNQYWITSNGDGTGTSRFKTDDESKDVNTFFVYGYREGKYVTYEGLPYFQMENTIIPISLKLNYNYNEWCNTSKLRDNIKPNVYNAGDIPTNTFISVTVSQKENAENYIYNGDTFSLCNQGGNEEAYIKIKPFELGYVDKILEDGSQEKQYDNGFIIDSKLKMIKGTYNGVPSGNIYSKNHIGGDYFKIPVCANDEYYIIKSTSENEFTVDYKHYYI